MAIDNLNDFEEIRRRMKEVDRLRLEDPRVMDQIREMERIQHEVNKIERNTAFGNRDLARISEDIQKKNREFELFQRRANNPMPTEQVMKQLEQMDRARDHMEAVSRVESKIERFKAVDRRIRMDDYAAKRLAEFKEQQKRFDEFEKSQARYSAHEQGQKRFTELLRDQTRFAEQEKALRRSSLFSPYVSSIPTSSMIPVGKSLLEQATFSAFNSRRMLTSLQERAVTAFALTAADTERLRKLTENSGFRPSRYAQYVIDSQRIFSSASWVGETFLGDVTQKMRTAIDESETEDEAVEKIGTIFEEVAKNKPKGATTFDLILLMVAILGVLIPLIPSVRQVQLAEQTIAEGRKSGEEQKQFQDKLLAKLDNLAENTKKEVPHGIPYLVVREAAVMSDRNFKSRFIHTLEQGTEIRVLAVVHQWVFVEFKDPFTFERRTGWVSKKYLNKLA